MNHTKLLWIGGATVALSAMMFNHASESLVASSMQPELATLASLYKKSDPRFLTAAFTTTTSTTTETRAPTKARTADAELAPAVRGRINAPAELSEYVFLHQTRMENSSPPEVLTPHVWSR